MSNAALAASTFGTLVRARQSYVAARLAWFAADDACECARRCECEASAARTAFDDAGSAVIEREASWAEYCEAFSG
jgi:hypothetical protein